MWVGWKYLILGCFPPHNKTHENECKTGKCTMLDCNFFHICLLSCFDVKIAALEETIGPPLRNGHCGYMSDGHD